MMLLEFEIQVFTILMPIIIVEVLKLIPIIIMIEGVTILTIRYMIRMKLKISI